MTDRDNRVYPVTTSDEIQISSLLRALTGDVEKEQVPTLAQLQNNYDPREGRVAKITTSGKWYLGNGSAWVDVDSDGGLSLPSLSAEDLSDEQGRADRRLNEDPNSPFSLSETNQTANLADDFDTEAVIVVTDGSSGDRELGVQLDGVTASDYVYVRRDGTTDSGTEFPRVLNTANGVGGEIRLATGGARLGLVNDTPWDDGQSTDSGVVTSDGTPPQSITFIEDTGQGWSLEIEVYGR